MSIKDFLNKRIKLIEKDGQKGFKNFVEPLHEMADSQNTSKPVEIEADGNWFTLNFKAIQVKENRLVISATRKLDGLIACSHDPSAMEYMVAFNGTRAAYLRGFYEPRHPFYGKPHIHWDIRSYTNSSVNPTVRIYVNGFRANDEIRKLILAMEGVHGTSNIINKYINDNLLRFQLGIKSKKTPQQIEKEWSKGLMESLGYHHVEATDIGYPKGHWKEVEVHWCKKKQDLKT